MSYTSLLASTDFDGVKGDVGTAATGVLTVAIIVLAVGIIIRVLTR